MRRPQNITTKQSTQTAQCNQKRKMPALNTTHPCTWGQISLFPALNAMVLTWLSLPNSCKKHCAYATTRDEIIFSLTSATILQLKTPAILKWLFSKFNFNHFLVSHLAQERESKCAQIQFLLSIHPSVNIASVWTNGLDNQNEPWLAQKSAGCMTTPTRKQNSLQDFSHCKHLFIDKENNGIFIGLFCSQQGNQRDSVMSSQLRQLWCHGWVSPEQAEITFPTKQPPILTAHHRALHGAFQGRHSLELVFTPGRQSLPYILINLQ